MATTSTANIGPQIADDDELRFSDSRRPQLASGTYTVTAAQSLDGAAIGVPSTTEIFVAGPRCSLSPDEIVGVYPPAGSIGAFATALPHIVLRRATLPWEREGEPGGVAPPPWLAVIVLEPHEILAEQTATLADLATRSASFPGLTPEVGDDPTEQVRVVDIDLATARAVLPTAAELALLAHVRQVAAADGTLRSATAVALSGRIARPDSTNIAHLVSVESQYSGGVHWSRNAGPSTDRVRLISLFRWEFVAQAEPLHDFLELAGNLSAGRLHLAPTHGAPIGGPTALAVESGAVPVVHHTRDGQRTAAWYRGPLVPAPTMIEPPIRPRRADELLRLDAATGMIDISLASAWELGRMLALEDIGFASRLHRWKRHTVHAERSNAMAAAHSHLGLDDVAIAEFDLADWFDTRLIRLVSVPFGYLVPEPAMLPTESIRFFDVDPAWVAAVVDGAFSLGRTSMIEQQRDAEDRAVVLPTIPTMSGFLLRSGLVSGWSGLVVEAFGAEGVALTPKRIDRLAPNVLLALFEGAADRVELHLPPEELHHGVHHRPPGGFAKVLGDGQVNVTMRDAARGVIDVARLAEDLAEQPRGSAQHSDAFALAMIEGAPKVTFDVGSPR